MTTHEERQQACRDEGHQGHLICSWCGEEAGPETGPLAALSFPAGIKVVRDTLSETIRTNMLTGEASVEQQRQLEVRLPDGRLEELDLRSSGGHVTWYHRLGRGDAHGASSDNPEDEWRRAIADILDPECRGRSIYGYVANTRGTVHMYSRSRESALLSQDLTVRALCGREVVGTRVSAAGTRTLCGGCINAT